MGMRQGIFRIVFSAVIFSFLLSGCSTISMDAPQEEKKVVVAEPVIADAGADAPEPELTQPQPPAATATIPPVPTATTYVPEGQLFFYNFEDVEVGFENERYPGIWISKPDFGIQVEVSIEKEYFLSAGVNDHPDGNISVYALNVTPPDETTAMIMCRVESGMGDDGKAFLDSGYIAFYRFDGRAKLVKRFNNADYVISDWKSGVSVNPEGVFNQLYLYCDGSRLLFMVNAEVVFDLTDSDLTTGDYAIGVDNPADDSETIVHFDKIAVFEP